MVDLVCERIVLAHPFQDRLIVRVLYDIHVLDLGLNVTDPLGGDLEHFEHPAAHDPKGGEWEREPEFSRAAERAAFGRAASGPGVQQRAASRQHEAA